MDATVVKIRKLIDQGESLTLEFKRSTAESPLSDHDLVAAVACLANGSGGQLLLGVEDGGTISGFQPRTGVMFSDILLSSMIEARTSPGVQTRIFSVVIDDKAVVLVDVPKTPHVVGTSWGLYTKRALDAAGQPECRPFAPEELMTAAFESRRQDWATFPATGVTMDDLDDAEIDRFRQLVHSDDSLTFELDPSNEDLLRRLGLFKPGGADPIKRGAVLLFGKPETIAEVIPNHEIAYQVTDGWKVEENRIERYPLFKATEFLAERIIDLVPQFELMRFLQRTTVHALTQNVVREVVLNALIHRNYLIPGPVRVLVDRNGLTISNPGALPYDMELPNVLQQTQPRSPLLANIMRVAGQVERIGRGVPRLYAERLRNGMAPPAYELVGKHEIRVRFDFQKPKDRLARVLATVEYHGNSLDLAEMLVLWTLEQQDHILIPDYIEEHRGKPWPVPETWQRLQDLKLIHLGMREGKRMVTLPRTITHEMRKSPYGRETVTTPVSAEEGVMAYVHQEGMVTRGQLIEEFGLAPHTATRTLQKLRDDGLLKQLGDRRTTRYILPETVDTT